MKKIIADNKGQMAILIVLVAAIALVCLAMTLNLTRVASTKTMTMIAAHQAASYTASQMASYAQMQKETQLGGKTKICKNTGLLSSLLTFIIVLVIAIIVTVASYGTAGPSMWTVVAAWAAVAVSAASVVLQATVIQPGLTKMWNKLQMTIATTEDRFVEQGLQVALSGVVSDSEEIPDYYDYNMNGVIWDGDINSDEQDKISRFSYYYTKHLLDASAEYASSGGVAGINQMKTILGDIQESFGLKIDHGCCADKGYHPALCNPCCVSKELRPGSCHPEIADPSLFPDVPSECMAGIMPNYPLNYDPLFCKRIPDSSVPESDPKNNTMAAVMGMDDGNMSMTRVFPNQAYSREALDSIRNMFRGEDSDGKLFPLLWMNADGAPETYNLSAADITEASANCHWCSADGGLPKCDNAGSNYHYWRNPYTGAAFTQLDLGDPVCSGDGCCVNRLVQTNGGLHGLQMDKVQGLESVRNFSGHNSFFEEDPPSSDCPGTSGLWRKGSDLYCSSTIPYYANCDKVQGMSCQQEYSEDACECSDSLKKDVWRDDDLDDFTVWLRQTATLIDTFMQTSSPALYAQIDDYYEDFIKLVEELRAKRALMESWRAGFDQWLGRTDFTGGGLWCLPNDPNTLAIDERAAVLAAGPYGSVQSVVACLDYNKDNAVKLQTCIDNSQTCATGPRRLGPAGDLESNQKAAVNADIKFRKRWEYLNGIYNLSVRVRDSLTRAIDTVDESKLNSLLAALESVKVSYGSVTGNNYLIYGWKSGQGKGGKLWHVVKADVWLPKRCDGFDCRATRFPWVKTYKKGSFKRCYELFSYNGCVKILVKRYDASPRSLYNENAQFGSGLAIWFPRNNKNTGSSTINDGLDECNQVEAGVPSGAFILSSQTMGSAPGACQNALAGAISSGTTGTELCAAYEMVGSGYQVRFLDCNQCGSVDPHND